MSRAAAFRMPMVGAAAAAGIACNAAMAAEWTVAPSAEVATQAEDNPRLLPEGSDAQTSIGARASLQVQRRTETLDLTANTRVGAQRYQQDDGLDRNDQQLDIGFRWRAEHVNWEGRAAATRDTTLTSEAGVSGITQFNQRREGLVVSIGPSWQASERLSFTSTMGWQVNRYPDPVQELTDYRYGSALLSASYVLTERTSISLVGSAGQFSTGDSRSETKNASVSLQAQYALSPLWIMSFGAGPSWVRANRRQDQGLVYSAALARSFERSSLSLSASRSQSPSGVGVMTDVDDASLSFGTQITERLTGTLGMGFVRRRDALPAFNLDLGEVRYRHIDASVSWLVSPAWRVVFGASNRVQRVGALWMEGALARDYEARLTLSWTGNSHVF